MDGFKSPPHRRTRSRLFFYVVSHTEAPEQIRGVGSKTNGLVTTFSHKEQGLGAEMTHLPMKPKSCGL